MHPDGYIELLDRAKDIVISGGENISTIEVEQALTEPRGGRSRPRSSASPTRSGASARKAFVVLRSGTSATPAELIEHVRP